MTRDSHDTLSIPTLTVERDALAAVLERVAAARVRGGTIPILEHVLIEADNDSLTVRCTSMDMAARASAPAAITTPGAVAVDGRLIDFVASAPSGAEIALAPDGGGTRCVARVGRRRATLPCLPAEHMPSWMTAPDDAAILTLPARRLRALLAATAHSMSNERTRPYLNGIHLRRDDHPPDEMEAPGPLLVAAATNGHHLSEAWCAWPETPPGAADATPPEIILPRECLPPWLRALDSAGADDATAEATVSWAATVVTLTLGGNVELATKLIDGTFPDVRRVIPPLSVRHVWRVDPADWARQATALLRTIRDPKSTILTHTIERDEMILELRHSTDGSEGEDRVRIEVETGGAFRTGFQCDYIKALAGAVGAEVVEVRQDLEVSPALIRPYPPTLRPDDIGRRHVLMPGRV
jgi:DNA polymerase-3 subunit beta